MQELNFGDRALVLISDSNRYNWAIHESDRTGYRRAFLTYIGGTNADLLRIRKTLIAAKAELRKAKRLDYPCELKVWGLAWDEARLLNQTYDRRVELCKENFNPDWIGYLLRDRPDASLEELSEMLWEWRYQAQREREMIAA